MIDKVLQISLPLPWKNKVFQTNQISAINYLVGPNGSGKTQFAKSLAGKLSGSRLLGTDRLTGLNQDALAPILGDTFRRGYAQNQFQHYRDAGKAGSGIDTVVLLQERLDLRIKVEATLSNLFHRSIYLHWDSGYLIPQMEQRSRGERYGLYQDECHGVKEILVLLTHLYNDQQRYLIIDEPELNLHPQLQSFFMQEVRRVAGNPDTEPGKKIFFLITHSPFILDIRSHEDLMSVISFGSDYSVPMQVANLQLDTDQFPAQSGRMNAHHRQLFFSDNPIFVEGILDAQLVTAMMEARGSSIAAAGSCIIDVGGVEEVNHYLTLCKALGKNSYFLYDLDSLFRGNLRSCISDDEAVRNFLVTEGLGNDLDDYCGQLERKLTELIKQLLDSIGCMPPELAGLSGFLESCRPAGQQWDKGKLAKARTAVMTAISRYKAHLESLVGKAKIEDVEGRRNQILCALAKKNVYVLPGGTLERYLPHYVDNEYKLNEERKQKAVYAEIEELSSLNSKDEITARYGELFLIVCRFPSKPEVNTDEVLCNYLSDYIHEIQKAITDGQEWSKDLLQSHLQKVAPSLTQVFSIKDFNCRQKGKFSAEVEIIGLFDRTKRCIGVDESTTPGALKSVMGLAET